MDLAGIPIEKVLDAGVSVILAIVVVYWNRSDSKRQIEEIKQQLIYEKERTQKERDNKLILLRVIEDNTKAITQFAGLVEQVLNTCERRCSNNDKNN